MVAHLKRGIAHAAGANGLRTDLIGAHAKPFDETDPLTVITPSEHLADIRTVSAHRQSIGRFEAAHSDQHIATCDCVR